jgi:DNA polymerase-1
MKQHRVLLIDADSWLYALANNYQAGGVPTKTALVEDIKNILLKLTLKAKATHYVIFLGGAENFRKGVYKVAPYKGNRKPVDGHIQVAQEMLRAVLLEEFDAQVKSPFEADDLVAYSAYKLRRQENTTVIVSSPDKDLLQIPGEHLGTKNSPDRVVSEDEARYFMWLQMLTGDGTDNITGVPGIGPVKAKAILDESLGNHYTAVLDQFTRYYGKYYGAQIYNETRCVVQLMVPEHPLYLQYSHVLDNWFTYSLNLQEVSNPNLKFNGILQSLPVQL